MRDPEMIYISFNAGYKTGITLYMVFFFIGNVLKISMIFVLKFLILKSRNHP